MNRQWRYVFCGLVVAIGLAAAARTTEAQWCKNCQFMTTCHMCEYRAFGQWEFCQAECGGCWVGGPCNYVLQDAQFSPAGIVYASAPDTDAAATSVSDTQRNCAGWIVTALHSERELNEFRRSTRQIILGD